jgi:hypothetical protein
MKNFIVLTLLFIVSITTPCTADPGETSLEILKFGIGARALGMGGAFSAVSDDVSAVYWNPAGLCRIQSSQELLLSGTRLHLEDGYRVVILYGQKVGGAGCFGLNLSYINMGSFDKRTDSTSNYSPVFGIVDLVGGVSYAHLLGPLSFGVNCKVLYSRLYDESGTGFAADCGVLIFPHPVLSLALAIQHIGAVKFRYKEELPFCVKAGAAIMPISGLTLSFDCSKYHRVDDVETRIGMEYTTSGGFSLRFGYKSTDVPGDFSGASLGLGILREDPKDRGIGSLDYAVFSLGDLGLTHLISLGYRF